MKSWIGTRFRYPHLILAAVSILFLLSALKFQPQAAVKEKLVVAVAVWRNDGGAQKEVQERTYQHLVQRLKEMQLDEVEVIKIPAVLNSAREVDDIALRFTAEVIIWGWYDDVAVRGYVDLANATEEDGMTNSLAQFLENGGSPETIRVLNLLSNFDYNQDGVSFCVPRWNP